MPLIHSDSLSSSASWDSGSHQVQFSEIFMMIIMMLALFSVFKIMIIIFNNQDIWYPCTKIEKKNVSNTVIFFSNNVSCFLNIVFFVSFFLLSLFNPNKGWKDNPVVHVFRNSKSQRSFIVIIKLFYTQFRFLCPGALHYAPYSFS